MSIPAFRTSLPQLSDSQSDHAARASGGPDSGRRRFVLGVPALAGSLALAPFDVSAQQLPGWCAS